MKYIGLDVHKGNTVACAISAGGKAVMSAKVRTNDIGLGELHARMNGSEYVVMMESSTYSYVVYRFFERLGIEAHVVHARSLRMITDSDKKTDRTDAEWIGRCLRLWKNKEIERRGNEDRNVELLESIPGIGRQTAVQLMSMIVDISRFVDPEKLCAYFGMAPRVRDSGGKENHGRMTKSGDPMMRSIMERVTLSHIRYCDSTITAYFRRKSKEMGTKKALMSAARKMLAVIHAVLKRGTPFAA